MKTITTDIAVIGAGGAGLRTAISAAEVNPELDILLISKVYPMRSHTVAAEGGSAAVIKEEDSLDNHFNDTVAGGDWLCEQDVVEYFVEHSTKEMIQMEQWGCPWSRKDNGDINVRRFGGMKVERTWFAADKTGFHMLHTLFQTSLKYTNITRFDECFVVDLLVENNQIQGLIAIQMSEGELVTIKAKSVVLATGGAGRVYHCNTNGGIVTGDGMALAYRHGVPLRDMEFVQYHPTGLPGTGILMTEGCRGEGGTMVNKNGYRYLQDYGLGPETPVGQPKNKHMELGPRDKVSQAFWHERQKGNTIKHPLGDVVHLDLRHLGEEYLLERLPFICELAKAYVNVDPAKEPIPIRPTVHYTMGGIETNSKCETRIRGLFAVGECASIGLHGANRLGSNSLAEFMVFGRLAGEQAVKRAIEFNGWDEPSVAEQAHVVEARIKALMEQEGDESWAEIRTEMGHTMEAGCGIYRQEDLMKATINKLTDLKKRVKEINIKDKGKVFNTDLLCTLEVSYSLDIAEAMVNCAILRRESRGAHQRLDDHCTERDDVNFLKHSLAFFKMDAAPSIEYSRVKITKSPPNVRLYGQAEEQAQQTLNQCVEGQA
ncbi:fumarate reductase (quinol) flavoprotein subunit [Vibrio ostreicida]|uniref:Fumarate reductase flavoprotein subunit n=1 Tax=Vibrio ostreicida TaxID=526588 RepID=A0ABT8BQQ2_9VIBR|nr:fumarate reductase (quinol) flavoprotein subunit [Vibrio ostreicida]MDN3608438.1 fumarate reductase (quinol) flavoprotein subunit [Vibrio ostreicida]NPD10259.1 fumarate reductase (quinol) flavoprotein subunit [Vibrio ostreicida]